MSFDWKDYWKCRPAVKNGSLEDALKQVGKTRFGRAVDPGQIALLVDHVASALQLAPGTTSLDLGCGNGLLTHALAARTGQTTALDYSPALLETARESFGAPNITYLEADLMQPELITLPAGEYDTAWSVEVIQNLDPKSLIRLLRWLKDQTVPGFLFLASGIPDLARIRAFYNTEQRWQHHLRNIASSREQMGRWWSREELAACGDAAGLAVAFLDLPAEFYTAHYRLDALFRRPSA